MALALPEVFRGLRYQKNLMHWMNPSEKDDATRSLERRLWDAAEHFVEHQQNVRWSGGQRQIPANTSPTMKRYGKPCSNAASAPESLPPAEDVKKVERRLASEEKKSLKNPDGLTDAPDE